MMHLLSHVTPPLCCSVIQHYCGFDHFNKLWHLQWVSSRGLAAVKKTESSVEKTRAVCFSA